MRHHELREALGRHLEGELGSAERRDLERHLEACASCRAEQHELRATVELLRSLPDPEPPADLVAGVLRRLESPPAGAGRGFGPRLRAIARGALTSVPAAALAAGLALLALASLEPGSLSLPIPGGSGPEAATAVGVRASRAQLAPAGEGPGARPSGSIGTSAASPEPPARDQTYALAPAPPPRPPVTPGVIDADALETVALDSARVPRRPRARFGVPSGVGASAAPEAAAGLPPRPALAACTSATAAEADEPCGPWLQGMLTLAQYDPRGFLAEVEALPASEAVAWLGELARFSRETRSSEGVASRLRATPDARIAGLARWFEPPPGEPLR